MASPTEPPPLIAPSKNSMEHAIPGVAHWSYDVILNRYSGTSECYRLRNIKARKELPLCDEHTWWYSVHHVDRERLNDTLLTLFDATIDNISIRYRTLSKGKQRWVLTRATITQSDDNNRPVLISGVDIDITELYYEREDNKSPPGEPEQLDVALKGYQQGLWHVDFSLGNRTENDTWRTMRGYPANSSYGMSNGWIDDIHPDDRAMVLNRDERVDFGNSNTCTFSYRQLNAHGEWRLIWSRYRLVERDANRRPLKALGIDTDITQVKAVETRNNQLSSTLEIAIQASGMGVWEWSMGSQVNIVDNRAREIFGIDSDQETIPYIEFTALIHEEDREGFFAVMNATVPKSADISVEYRINHPWKGIRHIRGQGKCTHAEGETPRYVGIVWDITDQVHSEKERNTLAESLNHAQRLQAIGELTGGIAHDFNNMLAVISGNAELLSLTLKNDCKYLDAIVSTAQRGALLTRSLLVFSRKQALKPTGVDLGVLINHTSDMIDKTLGDTVLTSCTVADELWNCKADATQLENALINLIVNARDAFDNGGSITIAAKNIVLDENFESMMQEVEPGDYVSVSVSDTGTGMSRTVIENSVTPFFTTKATGEGHGLGLSMVFGFIKQSNGHMTIDSKQGIGTVVTLFFPRYKGSGIPAMIKPLAKPAPLPGNGETILLVEDEQLVQKFIKQSLTFLGYQIICVNSGAEALQEMVQRNNEVKLVISDIVLSDDMNGFELGAELFKRFPSTRILYISGYALDALNTLKKHRVDSHDVEILEKPFTLENLALHISQRLRAEA